MQNINMMKKDSLKMAVIICLLLSVMLLLDRSDIQKEHVEGTWRFQNVDVPHGFPQMFLYMDNITLYEDNTFIQVRDGEALVTGTYYRTKNYIRFTSVRINGIPNGNTYRFRYRLKNKVLILEKDGEDFMCFEQNV